MLAQYFVVVFFIALQCVTAEFSLADLIYAAGNISEDGRLGFCELLNKYNYPCESYEVTTEDGYILTLFHIPGDSTKPVFMQHGFLDSSKTWIIRAHESLAAYLHNNTYDLWLGNTRGNMYSRNHTTLNPDGLAFWEFSFHEMAQYDLPAMIDFVLEKTGQQKVQVIGHSQGTQVFFILGVLRPEYAAKIKNVLCLAPIAYLHHSVQPLFPLISLVGGPLLGSALGLIGHGEFARNSSELVALIRTACTQGLVGYTACGVAIPAVLFGSDPAQFEPAFLPTAFGHYPSGSSVKNLVHLAQILQSKKVQYYDYGLGNLEKYGSLQPPVYDLTKVPFKISLYVGLNDRLADVKDVQLLRRQLPHVVEYYLMPYAKWNHIDFVWGKFIPQYLCKPVLKTLKKYY